MNCFCSRIGSLALKFFQGFVRVNLQASPNMKSAASRQSFQNKLAQNNTEGNLQRNTHLDNIDGTLNNFPKIP